MASNSRCLFKLEEPDELKLGDSYKKDQIFMIFYNFYHGFREEFVKIADATPDASGDPYEIAADTLINAGGAGAIAAILSIDAVKKLFSDLESKKSFLIDKGIVLHPPVGPVLLAVMKNLVGENLFTGTGPTRDEPPCTLANDVDKIPAMKAKFQENVLKALQPLLNEVFEGKKLSPAPIMSGGARRRRRAVKKASKKSSKKASKKASQKGGARRRSKKASSKKASKKSSKRGSKKASQKGGKRRSKKASSKKAASKRRSKKASMKGGKRRSRAGSKKAASKRRSKKASSKKASMKGGKRRSRAGSKKAASKRRSSKKASMKGGKRKSRTGSKKAASKRSSKKASMKGGKRRSRAGSKKGSKKASKRGSKSRTTRK